MEKIKEVIVVEGRDDEVILKKAVDAEIIITHGFGITEKTFRRIEEAQKRCGVIVFTDPDFAGEQIRKRISKRVKGVKHCFISRSNAMKGDNIGVENATVETVLEALSKVKTVVEHSKDEFTKVDLVLNDLVGSNGSLERRDKMGKIIGIGYGNGKQFLSRLNNYGVTREEFNEALKELG